jgi:hypothetical protein
MLSQRLGVPATRTGVSNNARQCGVEIFKLGWDGSTTWGPASIVYRSACGSQCTKGALRPRRISMVLWKFSACAGGEATTVGST